MLALGAIRAVLSVQPVEAMGEAAVALLVSQVANMAVSPGELLFEAELAVRGSTGRGPGGHEVSTAAAPGACPGHVCAIMVA